MNITDLYVTSKPYELVLKTGSGAPVVNSDGEQIKFFIESPDSPACVEYLESQREKFKELDDGTSADSFAQSRVNEYLASAISGVEGLTDEEGKDIDATTEEGQKAIAALFKNSSFVVGQVDRVFNDQYFFTKHFHKS